MNPDNIKTFWESLLTVPQVEPSIKALLPSKTTDFLKEIGLPVDSRLRAGYLTLKFTPDQLRVIEDEGKKYIVIGYQSFVESQITIEEQTGELYYIKQSITHHERHRKLFINTSLEVFMNLLMMCLQHRESVQHLLSEIAAKETLPARREEIHLILSKGIDLLESKCKLIDEKAIITTPSWWRFLFHDWRSL